MECNQDDIDDLYEHFHFKVDKGQDLLRIDKFLMNFIENASRNKIQNASHSGNILVNGKPVKPNYRVKPLDVIRCVFPYPPKNENLIPENIPINIVYEDNDIIVINKEAGMVVHPAYGNYSGTLVNAVLYHINSLPQKENEPQRPGLVHRIDKDTSGLLVIAKTEYAMTNLAKQFFDKTVERTYYAIVWGDLKEDNGTIIGNIGRDLKDRKKMAVYDVESEKGKNAVTHYQVLKRFRYVTLVKCNLETGRTHQIRVHFKHIGHPLFNDHLYGGDKVLKGTIYQKYKQFINNCFDILPRQALHAKTLGFIHPEKKNFIQFDSELPDDMINVLKKWETYIF